MRAEPAGQAHSERLLPLVDAVLRECGWALRDLDAIAFGAGPGSFTGVRIACGVAQGLAFAAALPLVPIPTLEALAQQALAHARRVARARVPRRADARGLRGRLRADRRRLAHAVGAGGADPRPRHAARDGADWFGAGDGFAAYPALAATIGLPAWDATVVPDARAIAALALPRIAAGEAVDAAHALPFYVRHRVALTTAERDAGVRL